MFRSINTTQGLVGGGVLLAIAALLIVRFGDRISHSGAAVAGSICAFGFLVPLLLGFVGQDYFLARNEIVIWLPLAIVFAGACLVPRARLAGGAFAVAMLTMFIGSQIIIQGNENYQRPPWRRLADRIGTAPSNRVLMVATGSAADPLKWYLRGVTWVQPTDDVYTIDEIDVIGSHRTENIIQDGPELPALSRAKDRRKFGIAQPRRRAPRGTHLLRRFHVRGWIVARFRLDHPLRIDLTSALKLAPHFFQHLPASLLVFLQRPTN
jgi:hypothetical protein